MDLEDFLYEVNGCISAPSPDFIKKYFGNAKGASVTTVPVTASSGEAPDTTTAVVASCTFPEWFVDFASTNRDDSRGSWSVSKKDDEHRERGLLDDCTQLVLSVPNAESKGEAAAQAVGIVCPPNVNYRDGLITLCASAQAVFYKQPTRLFLHGFYIRGSLVELWAIDRSGLHCSEVMDVQKDLSQFLSLFLQYEQMTDQELGASSAFSVGDEGRYITLDGSNEVSSRLHIDSEPIVTRKALGGPATVVYRGRLSGSQEWTHAVKFKWAEVTERPENELLEIALEKNAWGAAQVHLYRELETTANLRRGLQPGKQRRFPDAATGGDKERQAESDGAAGIMRFTDETRRSFSDQVLICIVTSPLGRALHTYRNLRELLEALRDVIKCHRSLYLDAGLLHGDISPGNMVIVDRPPAGAGQQQQQQHPRGILIDLELATPRDPAAQRDPSVTYGTRPFMSVGYMSGGAKTYREDLEAFLYVLLHMVVGDAEMDLPEGSRLWAWGQGRDWDALAARKLRDMAPDAFRGIVDEIPPARATARGLAETMRGLLFPLRDGKVWAGTDHAPEAVEALCDGVIAAFDAAIALEEK